ncbi:MAG TPA: hypothetical protein VGL81_22090 [Polyangiaceae bacterium]
MSNSQKIARLEALLARVVSRAAEPRRRAPAVAAAHPPVQAQAPAEVTEILDVEVDEATIPPPPIVPVRATAATEAEVVMEVEVVQEAAADTVIGVPAEEVTIAESLGSRERLVAAAPVPLAPAAAAEPSPPEALEVLEESPPEILAAVEEVEEAPLSSRRPVAPEPEERLADMAFGAEEPSPPRHTPPPESGRLPAAPAVEFDADVTGVREATPLAPPRPRELVPEATRAALESSDAVADLVGEAQRFAPATFAALLDASLAL